MLRINDCLRGAGGARSAGSSGGAGRTAGRTGRALGAGRAGGAGGPLHGRGVQRTLHLPFQEDLVLHGGLQQAADALIGVQHVLHCGGRTAEAGQGSEDILHLLALGVEDMAQTELLHGDGGKNLIHRIFPLNGRVYIGKTGQRHSRISFQILRSAQRNALEQRRESKGSSAAPGLLYASARRRVPAGTKPPALS